MKKLIKIAFILPSLKNLGPIIVVKDIVDGLLKHENVSVTVFYFDNFKHDILSFDVDCIRINFFHKNDFSDFDIVHSHGLRPDIYTFFNKTCGVIMSTQHNIIFEEYIINNSYIRSKLVEKIWTFSLLNKRKIVAIGETAKKYYESFFYSKGKVINIPNGRTLIQKDRVPIEDLKLIENFKKDYICIGTCTRVIKRKGHKQIIQSLVQLKEFCFVLIGDGEDLKELQQLANQLNVQDRCLFLGYRKNAIAYLKLFDIFSQTSYSESISIALLEAAAAKKAIICSDIPVNRDVFSDDEVAFFALDDIESLVYSIRKLFINKHEYESKVFKKYQQEYTSEKMVERYYELYTSLINEI